MRASSPTWMLALASALAGCASKPLVPYSTETPPLVRLPAAAAGVGDGRARFREIFCAILQTRQQTVPDYRPCEEALTRVGTEPPAPAGQPSWAPRAGRWWRWSCPVSASTASRRG